MNNYTVHGPLTLPGLANPRYQDLSLSELRSKRECRVIGGDQGDLYFTGYDLDYDENCTVLREPVLRTSIDDLTNEEVFEIARDVLINSFESIGLETVEHS